MPPLLVGWGKSVQGYLLTLERYRGYREKTTIDFRQHSLPFKDRVRPSL